MFEKSEGGIESNPLLLWSWMWHDVSIRKGKVTSLHFPKYDVLSKSGHIF